MKKYDPAFNRIKIRQNDLIISNTQIQSMVLLFGEDTKFTITPKIRIEAEEIGISEDKLKDIILLLRFAYTLDSYFYISSGKLRIKKMEVFEAKDIEEK